jgi:hypothetical protein
LISATWSGERNAGSLFSRKSSFFSWRLFPSVPQEYWPVHYSHCRRPDPELKGCCLPLESRLQSHLHLEENRRPHRESSRRQGEILSTRIEVIVVIVVIVLAEQLNAIAEIDDLLVQHASKGFLLRFVQRRLALLECRLYVGEQCFGFGS